MSDETPKKRFFRFEAMTCAEDTCGITYSVVARDLQHAFEAMSKMDLTDYVKVDVVELDIGSVTVLHTYDDEARNYVEHRRDFLDQWELGTVLCSEY